MQKPLAFLAAAMCAATPAFAAQITVEAESFTPQKNAPGWKAGTWGENYYAGSLANTFLSRKAFLGAPESAPNAVATTEINVAQAGNYVALMRYEAAPRFETKFTLRIEQNGKVWERLYGARENVKVWAFSEKLKPEVFWPWGAVENVVWEGHDTSVPLVPGKAKITLIAPPQSAPAAKRNVDVLVLTTDKADVDNRIAKEPYLPLDGLLTQSGDLFVRVRNKGTEPLTLNIPPGHEHSPYWVHIRTWAPKKLDIPAGKTTDWMEVGSMLDSLNDGQWDWKAESKGAVSYDVEFGVPGKTGITPASRYMGLTGDTYFAYDANTNITKRVRTQTEVVKNLVAELKKQKVVGKAPTRTLIYGYSFDAHPNDPEYTAAVKEFIGLVGTTAVSIDSLEKNAFVGPGGLKRGYLDLRGRDMAGLEEVGKKYQADGTAENVVCISMGDEIGLPLPPADDHEGFRQWLQNHQIPLATLGAASWDAVQYSPAADRATAPVLFYYSRLYAHDYGIAEFKKLKDTLLRYFPNAGVGANFSPHHGAPYLGETHKWINLFRQDGFTMPWSEDYVWQIPIGSQQMNLISVDLMRAGIAGHPNDKIHFYVMPHDPGNTPDSWRRQFYGVLGHGTKILNLFEFRPVQAAYTENYVNSPLMYKEVRRGFYELGQFEDIVQDGAVVPAQTGLWFSETGDVWDNNRAPFGANKRTMYVAIRQQQLPLDIVTEGDDISRLKVLYLTDRNVSRAASQSIANWVKAGGTLMATAGAGLRDEFDKPNTIIAELLGVNEKTLETDDKIGLEKQDLPFASALNEVSWNKATMPALGAVSHIELAGVEAVATFKDGSPAVVKHAIGQGTVIYAGFLPGLSYFKPAIPMRPVDRGSTNDSMAHLIPNQFDKGAYDLIGLAAQGLTRPVVCSDALVENTVIKAPQGSLVTLVNWRGAPVKGLTVRIPGTYKQVSLASGGKIKTTVNAGQTEVTLDLPVADAIILK